MVTTQDEFINKLKTNLEDKFESGEIGNKEITPVEGVHLILIFLLLKLL